MNNRGKLWIIPDEEQILQEVFESDIKKGISHTSGIQEFSNKYKLGYKFSEEDYQKAPCDMALLGHMVIKTEEETSLVVCYLPERVTDRQYNWLYQNNMILNNYVQIGAFSLHRVVDDSTCWKEIYGIQEIMKEAGKKNLIPKEERKR